MKETWVMGRRRGAGAVSTGATRRVRVLLQGNLKEFNLPNVFQLVKMSAKTGALSITREGESGRIFFRNGQIYFATAHPGTMPLGERLVKAGHVTSKQLRAALAEQKKKSAKGRIGAILLEHGYIDRATLEQSVRDQIEDVTFNFFSWTDGDFTFEADETITDEDIHVEMKVESVIMEGCRRIDEWELIFATLGSLERVPRLRYNDIVEEDGGVKLAPDQWRVVCWVDGRHDINTVLKECGLDRFNGAKIIYDLNQAGLLTVSDSAIEEIGNGRSIVVRGPIDVYNQVFISTLADSNVTEHLRVELIDEREIEVPMVAASYTPNGHDTDYDDDMPSNSGDAALVFTATVSSPEEIWRRFAEQSSAFIVLANANSIDSLKASVRDLNFVRKLGTMPIVVATYVSMEEDSLDPAAVAKAMNLADGIPILTCGLRDHESVEAVVKKALELIAPE
jgi:signal recognition particle receptor subunit beta